MTGRPWYAFYPDAYERDAGSLSYVQDSAYRRMLDHYYKTGEPLPLDKDAIYRACRAMKRDERAAIVSVLAAFFTKESDGYHQLRADGEISKASDISAKRSDAANKRYSKPPANADAHAQQLDTHSTSTSTATPSEAKASSVTRASSKPTISKQQEVAGFAEFYDVFPLHKARPAAAKAYARALSRATPAALLDGASRYAKSRAGEDQNFTKHPATWLNNDCWLDQELPTNQGRQNGKQTNIPFGSALSRVVEERAAVRAAQRRSDGDFGAADDGLEDILGGGHPQLRLADNSR